MSLLHWIFSPLIFAMQWGLELFHSILGSYGWAIILLSLTVKLLTIPISRAASRMEGREQQKQAVMAPALAEAKTNLRGRDRFERIEEIYTEHGYHPIMSMGSLLPLLFQIPFLLSALFLLADYPPLRGQPLGVIPDLALPDRLIQFAGLSINVIPIALICVALIELAVKPGATRQTKVRFLIVSAVLVVLIYPLPAGVCLYWFSSNFWSLVVAIYRNIILGRKAVK